MTERKTIMAETHFFIPQHLQRKFLKKEGILSGCPLLFIKIPPVYVASGIRGI
jgi:hypothetical protein